MEEKVVIESKSYNWGKILLWWLGIAFVVWLILHFSVYMPTYNDHIEYHNESHLSGSWWSRCSYDSAEECAKNNSVVQLQFWLVSFMPATIIAVTGIVFCLMTKSMQIIVTDKRVYGKTYFGRSVDLPLDSVSAVGSRWPKGIAVATSSGKISFLLIKNAQEIHEEIRKLLITRQEVKTHVQSVPTPVAVSSAEELKQYKELLDNGIISQEEFDAKKKQLLGF